MSNQHTTQHFSLHFWKQSKAKLIVSQGDFYSINKRNIYVFDALSILFQMKEGFTFMVTITKFTFVIFHLSF